MLKSTLERLLVVPTNHRVERGRSRWMCSGKSAEERLHLLRILANHWPGRTSRYRKREAPKLGQSKPHSLSQPRELILWLLATPLPADRPKNAEVANVYDANQEFLTDWLVRQNYDEAVTWISDSAMACINIDADAQEESLASAQTREQLRKNMAAISDEMGQFENLTQVIDAVLPWRKAFRVMEHPFEGDFSMVEAPDAFAAAFSCDVRDREAQDKALASGNLQYGNYYASIFRFKVANNRGGVLGLIWAKETDGWRIVSWEVFEP